MFVAYPTYSRYRSLARTSPMMIGEDVFALQTALIDLDVLDEDGADGFLGDVTGKAIKAAQVKLEIIADGIAGGGTQQAIIKRIADLHRMEYKLPAGLQFGQVQHESSCRLGNYSDKHSWDKPESNFIDPATGRRFAADLGPGQRNSRFTKPEEAFDVPLSLDVLGSHLRAHFDLFKGVSSTRRRWALAAGAWNAPAWAKYLAKKEGATQVQWSDTARPSDSQRATLEQYMQSTTAYLVL